LKLLRLLPYRLQFAAVRRGDRRMSADPVGRVRAFFESISPDALGRIDEVYAADAWFKDPFNEVRGIEAIRRIFSHMFEQVDSPRFVVREDRADDRQAFLTWTSCSAANGCAEASR